MSLCRRTALLGYALCFTGLLTAAPAVAISVGVELLVGIDGRACPQQDCTAFGGADVASNTPLDLAVAPGERLEIFVLIDFGLPMNRYETLVSVDAPNSLSFVSANDVSNLGFFTLADPNDTLSDGTPGSGDADSNFCDGITCVAPSSNALYRLVYDVVLGFSPDALRDLTVAVEAIDFERTQDSLDAARDTASLRLQALPIPEPGSAALLALGLGVLAAGRGRRARASRESS